MNDIEHQLKVLDHRQKEDEKFLDRQYEGKYAPSPYSSGTYNNSGTYNSGRSETVMPRKRNESFDSSDPMYTPRRQRAPAQDPLEQDVRKPDLGAPSPADDNSKCKAKDSSKSDESEPQAMNLDNRITGKAIAPRERLQIVTKESKLQSIAKLNKQPIKTSENHSMTQLAHH